MLESASEKEPKGIIVFVHPDGMDAAAQSAEMKKLPADQPVLLMDAFQTGSARAQRDRSADHFLGFNRSDDAARVQDILTALAFVSEQHPNVPLGVSGVGKAKLWCQLAAAIAPKPVKLYGTPLAGWSGSDDELLSDLFIPGLNRAGGWEAVQRLTK
jgi:hypothetical protein